jgi:polar amino acid transport system permease protein
VSEILPFLPFLLEGVIVTLQLTAVSLVIALVAAFVSGLGRMSPHRALRYPAGTFVEVFRGTSLLVQLFWFFFALPLFGIRLSPFTAAVLALGLNAGAYGAEIVRGAVNAVPRGQREATVALSMSSYQRMRRVVLPQALPAMLPPFGNVMIDLLKNTSLVSLVTVSELTFRAQTIRTGTGETTAVFGLVLVLYFAMAWTLSQGRAWVERRVAVERPPSRRQLSKMRETTEGKVLS